MKNNHNPAWIMVIIFLCLMGRKPFTGYADVLAKVGGITFLKSIDHAPKRDPFEYKNTANFSGQIVYSPLIVKPEGDKSPYTRYVVIRTLSSGKQISIKALPVVTSLNIYGFQFSPNGRYILFKAGTPLADPSDPYLIFIWDTNTNKVTSGPRYLPGAKSIAFYRILWSPSGQYLAYCRGGDVNGNEYPFPDYYTPLNLYTYDLKTGQEHFIVKAPSVRYFTWSNSDKLLFSITATEYAKQHHKTIKSDDRSSLLNIYQSSPTGKDIQLLIKDGFVVYPSPEGTKFVFMSNEDIDVRQNPKKYKSPSEHAYVDYPNPILYDSKDHTFSAINNLEGRLQKVIWLPDGKELLLAEYEYASGNKGILRVSKVDLSSIKQKQVAQFEVQDIFPFTGSISYHQFDKIALSKDMHYLFVKAVRQGSLITTSEGVHYHDKYESIQAADMQTSNVVTICTLHGFGDIGWYNLH